MNQNRPQEFDWTVDYPKELAEAVLDEIRSNPQACKDVDEIKNLVGPFGLSASNPIPTYGVASSNIYLKRLRTETGHEIQWKRIGSMNHQIVAKPIDHYEIFVNETIKIADIYISPYHWTTSLKAPSGFKVILYK